jgi:hypothetical protein
MFTDELTCSSEVQGAFIIKGNLNSSTRGAFCALSISQQSGSAIAMNNRLYFFDQTCSLRSSTTGLECSSRSTANLFSMIYESGSGTAFWGFAITIVFAVVVVIIMVYAVNKRYSCKHRCYSTPVDMKHPRAWML